ncbi:MAG: cadherin-like domain-containing protein [Gammaproteobacteria bacterium]|nr:cadherin-like domain-containing protein [Gammaproteobacteria bacterium]
MKPNKPRLLLGALLLVTGHALAGSIELLKDLDAEEVPRATSVEFLGSTSNGLLLTLADAAHPARLFVANSTGAIPSAVGGTAASVEFPTSPHSFQLGQFVLFGALSFGDQSVWRSDGTGAGTVPLTSGSATWLGLAGNTAIFHRRDPANPAVELYSLWRTDGTPTGTFPLDIGAGSRVDATWSVGSHLYFTVSSGGPSTTLMVTDGTQAGTGSVVNLGAGSLSSVQEVALAGSIVLVCARDTSGLALFRLNSPGAPPTRLASLSGNYSCSTMQESMLQQGASHFFIADRLLWRTDGTPAGTIALTSQPPTAIVEGVRLPLGKAATGIVFAVQDNTQGPAIWISDGTLAGTKPYFDPVDQSYARVLASANGAVFFTAGQPIQKLFRTNGQPSGTREVPLRGGGVYDLEQIQQVLVTPTQLYIHSIVNGVSGTPRPWWRTDLGGVDVIRLSNAEDGPGDAVGERLYFQSRTGDIARLSTSNGTTSGTTSIQVFPPSGMTGGSAPGEFESLGPLLLFSANTRNTGRELWRTDGTSAGSVQVRDINPGAGSANPRNLRNSGSLIYFMANDSDVIGPNTARIWRTDGTANGTFSLDVPPPFPALTPCKAWVSEHGGRAYFFAEQSSSQLVLMSTDGTSAGTRQEASMPFGVTDPCNLLSVGGRLVFTAVEQGMIRLWSTTGTADDIQSITPSSVSGSFVADQAAGRLLRLGNRIYFAGYESAVDAQLWRTDGTPTGTVQVTSFPKGISVNPGVAVEILGDRLLVSLSNPEDPARLSSGLYVSDGTAAGTSLLRQGDFSNATVAGDLAYFSSLNSALTEQLGITDGTVEGTRLYFTSRQAGSSLGINQRLGSAGVLYMMGPIEGGEAQLWMSDGTAAGTRALSRFTSTDGALLDQESLALLEGRPIFVFSHNSYGAEPYIVRNLPPQSTADVATVASNSNVLIPVLGNDADPDGSAAAGSIQFLARPTNGTVAIEANQVRYTPNSGYSGTDSFRYRMVDDFGAISPAATVTVTVTAPPPSGGGSGGNAGGTSGGGTLDWQILLLLVYLVRQRGLKRPESPN